MARVLVVSLSDLSTDPRVDRQIEALLTRHRVVAAGLAPPRHPVDEFIELSSPPRSIPGRVFGVARLLGRRYEAAYWNHPTHVAVLERLRDVHADVVLANDLETLPIALRLGPPVVFDAHEHAPTQGANKLWWRALLGPYVRSQCRRYIPQASAMMTVGPALADAYERETGVRATVVTNAPRRHDLAPTPVHNPVRILHHGTSQPGRGLEEMVRVAELLDDRFRVDFMLVEGWPGYRDKLIRRAASNPRVAFPPPQPMHALVDAASAYDIGLFLLPPVSIHRRFALPNKLFEFIQARLAVAIGPSPEMARIVREYGCGIVADDFRPEALAAALNALDDAAIAAFKAASDRAAGVLCAEQNEEVILRAVETALVRRRDAPDPLASA
jgi:glycosyltransferase involved in cell wall biosynthesis